jgi:hypothetical protein
MFLRNVGFLQELNGVTSQKTQFFTIYLKGKFYFLKLTRNNVNAIILRSIRKEHFVISQSGKTA